jgi:hypothetical protein
VAVPLAGFDVVDDDADFFATTRTSGFGVSGGESAVAEAGEYFSFQ